MKKTLALALAAAALAAAPPPAHAGTYDVWSCAGPSGEPLPAKGWESSASWGIVSSTCGQPNGALRGRLDDREVPSGSFARWTFEAPSDTTVASVTIQRTATASGHYLSWMRTYFLFRDAPVVSEPYGLDVCAFVGGPCARPGDPAAPLSDASRFTAPSVQAGRLIASAECGGPNPCPPQGLNAVGGFSIYRAQIGLVDSYAPVLRVPPAGGLLENRGAVDGTRSVTFDGSDRGGGLRAAEVVVDGVTRARSPIAGGADCREPFSDPVPCPLAAAGAIELDTSVLENGRRGIQVALLDAAGNRTLSDPVIVHVHNDKEPNGAGASRVARLTARFGGSRKTERHVGFGKTAVVKGQLVDGADAPIRGATLQVFTRLDRLGARERAVSTVRTGVKGHYRWLVTRGPSRFIRIGYRAYGSDEGEAATADVKLGVRPKIALTVQPHRVKNRGRITFRGRLVGGPGKGGAQLTIEAVGRDVRSRVPVTTLRTDARGRFRFSYRFLRSFAPFTYRFRARLMRQASYPYADGASRIVTVRIVR